MNSRVESRWRSEADAKASAPFTWKVFTEKVPESEAQRATDEQSKFRRYVLPVEGCRPLVPQRLASRRLEMEFLQRR